MSDIKPEEIPKKAEETAKKVAEKAKETVEVFKAFTPSVARGVILFSTTIPMIYLIGSAVGAVAPFVTQYIYIYAPLIVQFISMFIALSLFALALGLVRRLAL